MPRIDFLGQILYIYNINASASAARPAEVFYFYMSNKCVLVIDGENFLHKVEDVLKRETTTKGIAEVANIDLNKLFEVPLQGLSSNKKIFYSSKLHFHPETAKKSTELIKAQRKLRNVLINQGYEFIIAGNVRAQNVNGKTIFVEKGVDVRMAVDLVSLACSKLIDTAILCSSDSDLQPAVAKLKEYKVQVIYLGFETSPNKGLTATTDRTILLRNSEILEAVSKSKTD